MKNGIVFAIVMIVLAAPALVCAQEQEAAVSPEIVTTAPQASVQSVPQSKEIAIYGEVQAVNADAKTISVQYYDYDSDSEKVSEVVAGKDTKLENVKTIGDIKKGDWVDVTYTVVDAKNVAGTILVEQEELTTEAPVDTENEPAQE